MVVVVGKVKVVGDVESVGQNGFIKRDMVVTTDEPYPQHITVQFVQDTCDLLDNFHIGDQVSINVNLKGREWTGPDGKVGYFNSIQGWKFNEI